MRASASSIILISLLSETHSSTLVQEAAIKTMEKKDAKLKETTTLLEEEITPTLNKLKADRSAYLEYQKFNVRIIN